MRTNIYDTTDDPYTPPTLAGWYDPDKCESWDSGTRWDGNNHVPTVTGSYTEWERLYRTPGGRWVLNHWSRWDGVAETHRFLADNEARDWLLRAETDETEQAIERYFGPIPDESPAIGRPSIGDARDIKLLIPVELLARIDAAADSAGMSRAEWLRTAAEQALSR